jgi:hypothetical protein
MGHSPVTTAWATFLRVSASRTQTDGARQASPGVAKLPASEAVAPASGSSLTNRRAVSYFGASSWRL